MDFKMKSSAIGKHIGHVCDMYISREGYGNEDEDVAVRSAQL